VTHDSSCFLLLPPLLFEPPSLFAKNNNRSGGKRRRRQQQQRRWRLKAMAAAPAHPRNPAWRNGAAHYSQEGAGALLQPARAQPTRPLQVRQKEREMRILMVGLDNAGQPATCHVTH